jgi:hypothetical protein
MTALENAAPQIQAKAQTRAQEAHDMDDDVPDPIDQREVFDIQPLHHHVIVLLVLSLMPCTR